MTTLMPAYKKCPKCGKIIMIQAVMSTNVMGYGLNYEPRTAGWDPKPHYVLACPNCNFTDYTANFKSIPKEEKPEDVLYDPTPTDVKYSRVGKKLKKAGNYKEAVWAFLTASWYSDSKEACLLKVLESTIKSFEKEELSKKDKEGLLNLGLNICNQIETEETRDYYRQLNKFGRSTGLITKKHDELFDIEKPFKEPLKSSFFRKKPTVKMLKGNMRSYLEYLKDKGADGAEIKEKFEQAIKEKLSLKFDPSKLDYGNLKSKKQLLTDTELRKFVNDNLEKVDLEFDSSAPKYQKLIREAFNRKVDVIKNGFKTKTNKEINKKLIDYAIIYIKERVFTEKNSAAPFLKYLNKEKELLKLAKENIKEGFLKKLDCIYIMLNKKASEKELKQAIPKAIQKKQFSDAQQAIKPIKRATIDHKPEFKKEDKKLLLKIADAALKNLDFRTASNIYYDLNQDKKFKECIDKALSAGSSDFTAFTHSFFKDKNDKEMLKKIGNAYLKDKNADSAKWCFKDADDKEGLIKTAYLQLERGWLSFAKEIYKEATGKEFDPEKKLLIKLGNKLLKEGELDKASDFFKPAKYKKGLIEVGNKELQKENGNLWRAVIVFKEAGYKEGSIKVIKRFIMLGQAGSALNQLKEQKLKLTKEMKTQLINTTLHKLHEGNHYGAVELYKEFKDKRIKQELEKHAKYLVKIGHPNAIGILKVIYKRQQLLELGDKLVESGRAITGKGLYRAAELKDKEAEDRAEKTLKKNKGFLKSLFQS